MFFQGARSFHILAVSCIHDHHFHFHIHFPRAFLFVYMSFDDPYPRGGRANHHLK